MLQALINMLMDLWANVLFGYYQFVYRTQPEIDAYTAKIEQQAYTELDAMLSLYANRMGIEDKARMLACAINKKDNKALDILNSHHIGLKQMRSDWLFALIDKAIEDNDHDILSILQNHGVSLYVAHPNLFHRAAKIGSRYNDFTWLEKILESFRKIFNILPSLIETDLYKAHQVAGVPEAIKHDIREVLRPKRYELPVRDGAFSEQLDRWVSCLKRIHDEHVNKPVPYDQALTSEVKAVLRSLMRNEEPRHYPRQLSGFIDFAGLFDFQEASLLSRMLPSSSLALGTMEWLSQYNFVLNDEDAKHLIKRPDEMKRVLAFSTKLTNVDQKEALFQYLKSGIESSGLLNNTFSARLIESIASINLRQLKEDKQTALFIYTLCNKDNSVLISQLLEKFITSGVNEKVYVSLIQYLPEKVMCSDKVLDNLTQKKTVLEQVIPHMDFTLDQLFKLRAQIGSEDYALYHRWLYKFNRAYLGEREHQSDYIRRLLATQSGKGDLEQLFLVNCVCLIDKSDIEQLQSAQPVLRLYADYLSNAERLVGNNNQTYNPKCGEMTLLAHAIEQNQVKLAADIKHKLDNEKLTVAELEGVSLKRFWLFAEAQGVVDLPLWEGLFQKAVDQHAWEKIESVVDLMLSKDPSVKENTKHILEKLYDLLVFFNAPQINPLKLKLKKILFSDQINANLAILKRIKMSPKQPNAPEALKCILKEHPDIKLWQDVHLNILYDLLKSESFKRVYVSVMREQVDTSEKYLGLFLKTLSHTPEEVDFMSEKLWQHFEAKGSDIEDEVIQFLTFCYENQKTLYAQVGFKTEFYKLFDFVKDEALKTYIQQQKARTYLTVFKKTLDASQQPGVQLAPYLNSAVKELNALKYFPDDEMAELVECALKNGLKDKLCFDKLFELDYPKFGCIALSDQAFFQLLDLKGDEFDTQTNKKLLRLRCFNECVYNPDAITPNQGLSDQQKKALWDQALSMDKKAIHWKSDQKVKAIIGLLKQFDQDQSIKALKKGLIKTLMERDQKFAFKLITTLKTSQPGVLYEYLDDWSKDITDPKAIKLVLDHHMVSLLSELSSKGLQSDQLFERLLHFFKVGDLQAQIKCLNEHPDFFKQLFAKLAEVDKYALREAYDLLRLLSSRLEKAPSSALAKSMCSVNQEHLIEGLLITRNGFANNYGFENILSLPKNKHQALHFAAYDHIVSIGGFSMHAQSLRHQITQNSTDFRELYAWVMYDMIMKTAVHSQAFIHLDNLNRYLLSIGYGDDQRQALIYGLALLDIKEGYGKRIVNFLSTSHGLNDEKRQSLEALIQEVSSDVLVYDMDYTTEFMQSKLNGVQLMPETTMQWDEEECVAFRTHINNTYPLNQLFMSKSVTAENQALMSPEDVRYVVQAGLDALKSNRFGQDTQQMTPIVKEHIGLMLNHHLCDITGLDEQQLDLLKTILTEATDYAFILTDELDDGALEQMSYLASHWQANQEAVQQASAKLAESKKALENEGKVQKALRRMSTMRLY